MRASPNLVLTIAALVMWALGTGVLFAAFAFSCWSLDPGEWPSAARLPFAFLWTAATSMLAFGWTTADRSKL